MLTDLYSYGHSCGQPEPNTWIQTSLHTCKQPNRLKYWALFTSNQTNTNGISKASLDHIHPTNHAV